MSRSSSLSKLSTANTIQLAIGIVDRRSVSAYERITQQSAPIRTNDVFLPNNATGFSQQPRIAPASSIHANTGYNTFLIEKPSSSLPSQPSGQGMITSIDSRIIHVDKVSDQVMSIEELQHYLEDCHPDALRRYNDAYLYQKIQQVRYLRRLISTKLQ